MYFIFEWVYLFLQSDAFLLLFFEVSLVLVQYFIQLLILYVIFKCILFPTAEETIALRLSFLLDGFKNVGEAVVDILHHLAHILLFPSTTVIFLGLMVSRLLEVRNERIDDC